MIDSNNYNQIETVVHLKRQWGAHKLYNSSYLSLQCIEILIEKLYEQKMNFEILIEKVYKQKMDIQFRSEKNTMKNCREYKNTSLTSILWQTDT